MALYVGDELMISAPKTGEVVSHSPLRTCPPPVSRAPLRVSGLRRTASTVMSSHAPAAMHATRESA
ncbi:hypothetical protein [Kitasatospora sp. NPDC001132]